MKKYKLVLAILLMTFSMNIGVNALTLKGCKYSTDFKEWLKLSSAEKANTPMPAVCQRSYDQINVSLKANPTSNDTAYSLVDDGYVTSVKNQKQTNSCWAYSAVASMESNLLKTSGTTTNLSPGHMELATQNSLFTPGRITFNRTFNQGGNYLLVSPYVLNQWGPINETQAYSVDTLMDIIKGTSTINANTVENVKANYSVNDIAYIMSENGCDNNTKSAIKNYLVQNGALAASIYMGVYSNDVSIDANGNVTDKFTNGEYYYYNGAAYTNQAGVNIAENQAIGHAVTIVGWDDAIDKTNFSTEPNANGAWLVKNSWGATAEAIGGGTYKLGNEGYYYVSYEDINICSNLAGFYNVNTKIADNTYYYDELGWIGELGAEDSSSIYIGNIYDNKTGKNEIIDKITFGTSQVGLNYTIYYSPNGNLTNYQNNVLKSGTVDHTGYTTVEISNKKITTSKFGIIIKFTNPVANETFYPAAFKVAGTIFANTPITQNVSFLSSDGNYWEDTTVYGAVNSIRVYTTSTTENIDSTNNNNNDDEEPVKPADDINVKPSDDTVLPINDNIVDNPQTAIEDFNIPMISMLFVSITAYVLLKKVVIFQKI